MVLVDIDKTLKSQVAKKVKKNKVEYPSMKHFINMAIRNELSEPDVLVPINLANRISKSGPDFNSRLQNIATAIAMEAYNVKSGTYTAVDTSASISEEEVKMDKDACECEKRTEVELIVKIKQIKPDKRGRSPCWWCNKKTNAKDALKRPMCQKCQAHQAKYIDMDSKIRKN